MHLALFIVGDAKRLGLPRFDGYLSVISSLRLIPVAASPPDPVGPVFTGPCTFRPRRLDESHNRSPFVTVYILS